MRTIASQVMKSAFKKALQQGKKSQKKRKKSLFSLDRAGNQSAHPGRADPSFTWDPFTA